MLSFTYTLVGVGPVCNTDCIVVFTKRDITVFLPGGKPILIGYREKELPWIWRFALKPTKKLLAHRTPKRQTNASV